MWRISFAQVRLHIGRLIASCLAIIIAIGFVVATLVLSDTTRSTMLKAVGAPYVGVAAVLRPDFTQLQTTTDGTAAGPSVTPALVDAIAAVTGVAAVSADSATFAEVELPGRIGAQYASVESVAVAPVLQWQDLASGRLPTADGEVAVSSRLGVDTGAQLTVTTYPSEPPTPVGTDESGKAGSAGSELPGKGSGVTEQVTVVGVVDLGSDPTADVAGRLFATAEQVTAWGGLEPIELRIAAHAEADVDALIDDVQAVMGEQGLSGTVLTGDQAAQARAAEFTRNAADLTTVLLVFAALALLIAGMVIANTFAVLLAQRTRELALLRCVGASASQIRRGVLVEAALTGLGASAIGVGVGVGLAWLTSRIAGGVDRAIPLEGLSVPAYAVLLGLGLGTLVTLLAALLPAAAATRVAPLAALRPADRAPLRSSGGLLQLALGVGLFLPGVAVLGYGVSIADPLIAVGGGCLSGLGTLLLLQRVIPPVVALAGRTVARLGGLPASLAAGNAARNQRRTAATATALLIGVTLTTAMIVGAASTKATADAELRSSYPTDVVVSTFGDALPAELLGDLVAVDGVSTGTSLIGSQVTGPDGQPWQAMGVDPVAGQETVRSTNGGVPAEGQVSIPSWLAASWQVAAGDPVTLTVETRSVTLDVIVNDASQSPTVTESALRSLDPQAPVTQIWLRLADDRSGDAVGQTVDEINDVASQTVPSPNVEGVVSLRQGLDSILDTMLLVVTALLGVAVFIALIGVGNTLALSVIERRQENGLLRALGLTRGQLRGLLAWEALLVAGVASVLGVVVGAVYGLAGTGAILGRVGTVVLDIPWFQILAVVGVATAAGVLPSVLPARRAARTSPVAAIAG